MRSTWHIRSLELILLGGLVASCGSDAPAGAPAGVLYTNGSRLRARVTNAGPSARRFDAWYDSKLASPCAFHVAEDRVVRCIPVGKSNGYAPVYADGTCATPVFAATSLDQAAPYIALDGDDVSAPRMCGADLATLAGQVTGRIVESWRIGAEQTAPALYARDSTGTCVQQPPLPDVTAVYALEKVAPSELVGVRNTRVEPRGAKLAAQIFEADDGSSFVGATFDVAAKQACTPSWVLGVTDDYRCYPIAPGGYDSCTPGSAGDCEGDLFAGYIGFCAPPPFTRAGGTSCDPADPAEMPAFESDLVGTGRIRLVVTHASDDKRALTVNPALWRDSGRYRRGPFFDTALQLPCDSATMDDGTIRCVTFDALSADVYADSACTKLIAENSGPDTCEAHGQAPAPRYAIADAIGLAHIYGLGAAIPPGQAYFLDTTTDPPECLPFDLWFGGYELTPGDATAFATMTSELE